jgi:hypothetical protein
MASHVHSDWSYDGSWSLERLAAAFSRRGYGVVLMCEHSQTFDADRWERYREACARASRPDLLLVPGVEYADEDDVLHLPVWGDVGFLGRDVRPIDLVREVQRAGAVSVLAHPWRRDAWQRVDPAWLPLLGGIEFWNRKYDGIAPRRPVLSLLEEGVTTPFVSLDFHTSRQFFPLAMVADFETGRPTVDDVYHVLGRGACRAELWRVPATTLAAGWPGAVMSTAEQTRRRLLPAARRVVAGIRSVSVRSGLAQHDSHKNEGSA